jgi:hypothetical protein
VHSATFRGHHHPLFVFLRRFLHGDHAVLRVGNLYAVGLVVSRDIFTFCSGRLVCLGLPFCTCTAPGHTKNRSQRAHLSLCNLLFLHRRWTSFSHGCRRC